MTSFTYYHNPSQNDLGHHVEDFLAKVATPVCLTQQGVDTTRTRAIVTLIHGNEPSGVRAVYEWFKSGRKPAVNVVCIVASVEAALLSPLFTHRMLPGERDVNRCFFSSLHDKSGRLAEEILTVLKHYKPEAVVDIHNTSGSGPAFGVVMHHDLTHESLVSNFAQRMLVTQLRLGALMEISEDLFPTVTIECGGREDEEADEIATEGVFRYLTTADVLRPLSADWGMDILYNPVRLELREGCNVCYADRPQPDADLTLSVDIEHKNFGTVPKGTFLGWVGEQGLDVLVAKSADDRCVVSALVFVENGKLLTAQDLKLFMVTTNPEIAKMDCLFYAVKDDGDEIK